MEKHIYVFTGEGGSFPGGVFSERQIAVDWIKKYSLSGVLSNYPIDIGLYDWAIENKYFEVKKENQKEAKFIGKFTCASVEHLHFENGEID
jgi:hypothetical protein